MERSHPTLADHAKIGTQKSLVAGKTPIVSESINHVLAPKSMRFLMLGWLHKLGVPVTRYRIGSHSGDIYFTNYKDYLKAKKFMDES